MNKLKRVGGFMHLEHTTLVSECGNSFNGFFDYFLLYLCMECCQNVILVHILHILMQ